jgi:hypothetical protein
MRLTHHVVAVFLEHLKQVKCCSPAILRCVHQLLLLVQTAPAGLRVTVLAHPIGRQVIQHLR